MFLDLPVFLRHTSGICLDLIHLFKTNPNNLLQIRTFFATHKHLIFSCHHIHLMNDKND